MKKKYFLITAVLCMLSSFFTEKNMFCAFAEEKKSIDDFSLNKTEIKLGEKINFQFSIAANGKAEKYEILTEEFTVTNPFEILSVNYKKRSDNATLVSGEITSFTSGNLKDIQMSVPVSFSDGTVTIFSTENQTFTVAPVFTKEEEEALKKVEDPSTIELRSPLPQEKFRLYFEDWLLLIIIIVILAIAAVLIYQRIIKKFHSKTSDNQKGGDPLDKLGAYEKFLFMMENNCEYSADRKETEIKLSGMSSALKELIMHTFEATSNAKSETTRELLYSMRHENIDDVLISNIGAVFNSMDMVKFAKAGIDQNAFNDYVKNIREFGSKINEAGKKGAENENSKI